MGWFSASGADPQPRHVITVADAGEGAIQMSWQAPTAEHATTRIIAIDTLSAVAIDGTTGDDTIKVEGLRVPVGLVVNGQGGDDTLSVDDVIVTDSADDGLKVSDVADVSIANSSFDSSIGDGIELRTVGDVALVNVNASGNDPGVLVSGRRRSRTPTGCIPTTTTTGSS